MEIREVSISSEADKRILVLSRGALGDVLLCLPFFAALPEHFGAGKITLVGTPSIVALLAELPFIDRVMDQNSAAWAGLYVQPPYIPDHLKIILDKHQNAVIFSSRQDDPVAANLKTLGVRRVMIAPVRPPEMKKIHLVDHIFNQTGVRPSKVLVNLPVSDQNRKIASEYLAGLGLRKSFVALQPGSGSAKKNAPLDHWLALAEKISRELDLIPLFICGPAETGIIQQIKESGPDGGWNVIESMALPVLSGVIALSSGYIGHDSGITHLAASLGVKTLALFGPTDPAQWAPRGEHVRVVAPARAVDSSQSWAWIDTGSIMEMLVDG